MFRFRLIYIWIYVDIWIYGYMDIWIYGYMDMWICGYVDRWICGESTLEGATGRSDKVQAGWKF